MPGLQLHTEGFVLLKQPGADRFRRFTVFSPEHGALFCLQRVSTKTGPRSAGLDLFDEAEFFLETSNQGRTWFIKEVRVHARHAAIGRSYETLRFASAFTALVARNPVAGESRPRIAALLRQALAAFDEAPRPDLVYFKSLYCFARDEGYPVRQQWWQELPAADRAATAGLLNRPLAGQTASATAVTRLIRRLEDYLRGYTEILLE